MSPAWAVIVRKCAGYGQIIRRDAAITVHPPSSTKSGTRTHLAVAGHARLEKLALARVKLQQIVVACAHHLAQAAPTIMRQKALTIGQAQASQRHAWGKGQQHNSMRMRNHDLPDCQMMCTTPPHATKRASILEGRK